ALRQGALSNLRLGTYTVLAAGEGAFATSFRIQDAAGTYYLKVYDDATCYFSSCRAYCTLNAVSWPFAGRLLVWGDEFPGATRPYTCVSTIGDAPLLGLPLHDKVSLDGLSRAIGRAVGQMHQLTEACNCGAAQPLLPTAEIDRLLSELDASTALVR